MWYAIICSFVVPSWQLASKLLLLLPAEPSKENGLVTVSCSGSYTPGVDVEVGVDVTATVQGCSDLHDDITSECAACADTV
jgi:hypothetical protein